MADGLRTIGRCPRCSGTLEWRDAAEEAPAPAPAAPAAPQPARPAGSEDAPHLVLGLPRR